MAHRTKLMLLMFFSLLLQVNCYTYFIHETCKNTPILTALTEAIEMARFTNARLQTMILRMHNALPTLPDQNDRRTFKLLFKTDLDDVTVRRKVIGVTEGIRSLVPAISQTKADIRFYCDNDEGQRYQVIPDIETSRLRIKSTTPNSKRTTDQESDDVENGVRWTGQVRPCQKTVDKPEAYSPNQLGMIYEAPYEDQPDPRAVITFCTGALTRGVTTVAERMQTEITNMQVQAFNTFASMLILHELLHAPPAFTLDVVLREENLAAVPPIKALLAYAWSPITELDRASCFVNNDNFGYFILWTNLAKDGYRLSKDDLEWRNGELILDQEIVPDTPRSDFPAFHVPPYNQKPPERVDYTPPNLTPNRPAPRPPPRLPTIPALPTHEWYKQWYKAKRQVKITLLAGTVLEQSSASSKRDLGLRNGAQPHSRGSAGATVSISNECSNITVSIEKSGCKRFVA